MEELKTGNALLDQDAEKSLELFNNILLNAAASMKKITYLGGERKENKPWFDSECKEAKKEANHALTKVKMINKKSKQKEKAERLQNIKTREHCIKI